ncbi:hypothetical protein NBRC10513_004659 [Rhodotorula toruloides]|uniref:mannan endo-1,4-beta-mannosidase n=1 Tax=Rhodotorula toruloides TaxID=5286 RepID=A0A2T0A6X9_RHOTO|nr:Glycoside hydrolase superfamily [Rhodotorula toruloides]
MGACHSKTAHPAEQDSPAAPAPAGSRAAPHAPQARFAMANSHVSRSDQFVERRGSDLYLGGQKFRFASLNAPELLDGDVNGPFEVRDTFAALAAEGAFGTAVTRTYTLRIKSKNIGRGHINGWSNQWNDWMWDTGRLKEMDLVLAEAAKAGVKLIIPIVNQDTGEDSNWVGSTADLTRYRYGLGSNDEARRIDWWTDHTMIESFKLIIDFLVNRVNSINGRRYGDDPTILAWETGNEMNHMGMRPAPASWTLVVAKHLKSRAPRTLVMDGSFARNDDPERCYQKEVLESEDVDIVSYHYYGNGEIRRVRKDCEIAKRHNKVFVAGEFGFFSKADDYASFMSAVDSAGGAGSFAWSLRPHSAGGGHKTHGEGDGHWSYHIPGWKDSPHHEFDAREASIVAAIRTASFKINGQKPPSRFPVPPAPSKPWTIPARGGPAVCFAGAAWAHRYQVIVRSASGAGGEQVKEVKDHTKEGEFFVDLGREVQSCGGQGGVHVTVRGISVDGMAGDESEALSL